MSPCLCASTRCICRRPGAGDTGGCSAAWCAGDCTTTNPGRTRRKGAPALPRLSPGNTRGGMAQRLHRVGNTRRGDREREILQIEIKIDK